MKKERPKNTAASYLLLIKNEKILLLRRHNTGYEDGKYSLPAGHVDAGETFTQCIIREACEEIDIVLAAKDLKVTHVMHRNAGFENDRIDLFFVAEKWSGEVANKEPHKCDDLSWHGLNNLPENVIPYVKQAIECSRDNIFYSEHGW